MLRLQTRPQFQAVLAGTVVAKSPHFALHRRAFGNIDLVADEFEKIDLVGGQSVWIGAMVPKRWAKRAVTRNAIKRQIYAVCDEAPTGRASMAYVIRLRGAFDRKQYPSAMSTALKQAVRAEVVQLWTRAATGL